MPYIAGCISSVCGSHSTLTASADTNHGPILSSRQPVPSPEPLQLHPCVYLTVTFLPCCYTGSLPPPTTSTPTPPCERYLLNGKERQINLMVVESYRESEVGREKMSTHLSAVTVLWCCLALWEALMWHKGQLILHTYAEQFQCKEKKKLSLYVCGYRGGLLNLWGLG